MEPHFRGAEVHTPTGGSRRRVLSQHDGSTDRGLSAPQEGRKSDGGAPSTTVVWKLVKMRRPAEGRGNSRPEGVRHRWYHRPRLAWGTPVTLKVRLVGGSTARVEVRARGGVAYYDGSVWLVDVLAQVLNQQEPERP